MKDKNILYNYLLHFNPFTEKWNAIRREDKEDYFNGECKNVISSTDVTKLIDLLLKQE